MKRNPIDEAISALKVAPAQTAGMCLSAVFAFYLFSTDSDWFGVAMVVAVIFTAIVWRTTPAIIEAANERVKARHRYPH